MPRTNNAVYRLHEYTCFYNLFVYFFYPFVNESVGHNMVKFQSNRKIGYPLEPLHGLLFSISSKGYKKPSRCSSITERPLMVRLVMGTIPHGGLIARSSQSYTNTVIKENGMREREMFYLTTHSTHFIYGDMASDIWLRTILIVREETRCRHIGYSFRLAARVLLYAPSHRQDNTYHGLCNTSRGTLAGTRNSSMGPPHEGSIRRSIAP